MLGIVTGLQSEARLMTGLPHLVVVSGGGHAEATKHKIEHLITQGATGLVSFGIAGGVDPALRNGSLVISATVIDEAGHQHVGDTNWLNCVLPVMPGAHVGPVYASDRIVETVEYKSYLFGRFNVLSADMESHHVAHAAEKHRLPFIIIRAVSDTASEILPSALGDGVDENGATRILPILSAILSGRLSLPAVVRAGRSAHRALGALTQARAVLPYLIS